MSNGFVLLFLEAEDGALFNGNKTQNLKEVSRFQSPFENGIFRTPNIHMGILFCLIQ